MIDAFLIGFGYSFGACTGFFIFFLLVGAIVKKINRKKSEEKIVDMIKERLNTLREKSSGN